MFTLYREAKDSIKNVSDILPEGVLLFNSTSLWLEYMNDACKAIFPSLSIFTMNEGDKEILIKLDQ
mgnify:CR=1 FL=1